MEQRVTYGVLELEGVGNWRSMLLAVGARGGAARGVSNAVFIFLLGEHARRRREGERHEFTRRCYRQPPGRPIGERAG